MVVFIVCRTNAHYRRSVAASLVEGCLVYVLERDRQEKRQGSQALAPPWWEFFHFKLIRNLVDDADFCIFGSIYEYKPPSFHCKDSTDRSPRYVITFRGSITKPDSFSRDFELDIHIIRNGLYQISRFEIAIQAVRNMVAALGDSNVWLAGHSLGETMAMLAAGKTMAKTGTFVEAFLFNPPFLSAPIERIKDEKVKHGLRIAGSVITTGLALVTKGNSLRSRSEDPFDVLSAWIPCLFVNPADYLCSEYVGYFEHRKKMEEIGAGHSLGGLFMNVVGKGAEAPEPLANLTVNLTPSQDFKQAHGLHQWWRPDLQLKCNLYMYKIVYG